MVNVKPMEFWATGPRKEAVQPLRRSQSPPSQYFDKLEPCLYSDKPSCDDVDLLTDDEILLRYQLGMLHFSTQ